MHRSFLLICIRPFHISNQVVAQTITQDAKTTDLVQTVRNTSPLLKQQFLFLTFVLE